MKRANLGRGLIIIGMALFFAYRYWQFGSSFYWGYIIVLATIGILSLTGTLVDRWQNIILNLGLGLVFLDFVFAEVNLREVGRELAQTNYWMLIPSMVMVMIHLYFRTLRSQWLLKPMGEVGFWPAFRALAIGIAGNTILPARAGEFLRAYVLGRSTGLSKTGVFATLVVERIFDGLTILLFLLVVIIFGVRNEQAQLFGLIGAVFYFGAFAALIIFILKRDWVDALVQRRLPDDLAKLALELLDSFGKGLLVLKNPQQLSMVLFWNFWTWIVVPISFWFALLAFDFGAPIPWQAPVLMLPALGIALSIPGPPGGVGLFHSAVVFTMNVTMPSVANAATFNAIVGTASIVIHLVQFGPEVLVGVIAFFYEGLSTADLKAGRRLQNDEADG